MSAPLPLTVDGETYQWWHGQPIEEGFWGHASWWHWGLVGVVMVGLLWWEARRKSSESEETSRQMMQRVSAGLR